MRASYQQKKKKSNVLEDTTIHTIYTRMRKYQCCIKTNKQKHGVVYGVGAKAFQATIGANTIAFNAEESTILKGLLLLKFLYQAGCLNSVLPPDEP